MPKFRSSSYPGVLLRSISQDDHNSLYQIFCASRKDLLAAILHWDKAQQQRFMLDQFNAQQLQYRNTYKDACFDAIILQGEIVGNLYYARTGSEIRLVDVTLLPSYQNRGIGKALIQDLLDEGQQLQKTVTLHVQQGNPAIHLYQRLGFRLDGEQDVFLCMAWKPLARQTS